MITDQPDDMPVFVLKAKDQLALSTVGMYFTLCENAGLDEQAAQVALAYEEIRNWQRRHPDLLQLPDHPHVPVEGSTPLDSPAPDMRSRRQGGRGAVAQAGEPVPVPPPVDALLRLLTEWVEGDVCSHTAAEWAAGHREIEAIARNVWATGVEEGRRQRDAEIHTNVLASARLAAAEAGFGMVPESVTVSYLTPDIRAVTLIEAYWKLRDHAAGLRDTTVYRKAAERLHEEGGRADERYRSLETRARGIEDGARDLAELLGVEEHEIERPAATDG